MITGDTRIEVVWYFLPAMIYDYRYTLVAVSIAIALIAVALTVWVNTLGGAPSGPAEQDDPDDTVEVRPARRGPRTGTFYSHEETRRPAAVEDPTVVITGPVRTP